MLGAGLLLAVSASAYGFWRYSYIPDVAARDYRLAYQAYNAGHFEQARAQLEQIVSLDPRMADAHALLGWTHWRLGELIEA